tara:strand:- start:60 stop:923 length:864 start_codon:yes stop_codon:yes gene_type:complete
MSYEAAAWAIQQKPNTAHEKLVLIAIADCFNKNNSRCDPSIAHLADVCLCNTRTVMRAIQNLEDQGFIGAVKKLGIRTKYTIKAVTLSHASPSATRDSEPLTSDSHDTTSDSQSQTSDTKYTRTSKNQEGTSKEPEQRDLEIATQIFNRLREINPDHKKPNLKTWAFDIEKTKRIDRRSESELWRVFMWATNDSFWRSNILSPKALRKQFDKLSIASKSQKGEQNGNNQRPTTTKAKDFLDWPTRENESPVCDSGDLVPEPFSEGAGSGRSASDFESLESSPRKIFR